MLTPACLRIDLLVLYLMQGADLASVVEQDESGTRGSLIDGAHIVLVVP